MKVGDLVRWKVGSLFSKNQRIGILVGEIGCLGDDHTWLVRWQNGNETYTWQHNLEVVCEGR